MTEAAVSAGVNVVAICPTCQEIRYKSIKPVASKEDATPANFQPVGDSPAVGPADAVPLCYVCSSVLSFAPAERFEKRQRGRKSYALLIRGLFSLWLAGRVETCML